MDDYPDQDEVRAILGEYEERLERALRAAWDDWLSVPQRSRFRARTRANLVFDFICLRINEEFDGVAGVRIINSSATMKLLFRDRLLIRFKKANRYGLGANIQTQMVLSFINPQLRFPGFDDVIRVEVCYHLDDLATRVIALAVTARERFRLLWSYELAEAAPNFALLPTAQDIPQDAEVRMRSVEETEEDTSK